MSEQEKPIISRFDSIRTRLTLAFVLIVLLPMVVISAIVVLAAVGQEEAETVQATYVMLAVFGGVALAAVVIAAFASLAVTRSIAAPLADLADTAASIAAGNFTLTAEIKRKDEIGALAQTFNFMTDKLRQAMEEMSNSEEKYRTLVDNVNIGIYRNTGGPHGQFMQANPAMARIFGYDSVEEFLKIAVADLYQKPEDRERYVEEIQWKGFVKDKELALRKKDGTAIWCSVTAAAQFDEKKDIKWTDGVLEDISEKKKLEEQLLQSQKMEAIGQLSGGIAHDFNNILTAIMGYANLLKAKTQQDDLLQSYVSQVLTASNRAKNLTKNLLAFSRKQIMNPRPVNVNEIITNLDKLLIQLIREDIELKTLLAPEDLTIMADSGQIEQVLVNLVTNARDAMPQGGALTIETTLCDIEEKYADRHFFEKQGKHACISITDTGTGMDAKTKEKIFEPFFTTKEVGRGTGLGLSIVYGIIKQHNGNINVYSEPGLGTTFRMYFPLIESKPEEQRLPELPEPKGGTETILLAEDDADVRELTKTILAEAGYRVLEATDGEDAIKVFDEHQDDIGLVLLDVIMPKKNGKEVYNWIKTKRPSAKVLFMSGYSADIIFKKGVLEEGLNLISKPVTIQELLWKVREVIDKKSKYEKAAIEAVPKTASGPALPEEREKGKTPLIAKGKHDSSIIVVDDDAAVLEYVSLLLEENGYSTIPCSNAGDAVSKLRDRRVDVVLTDIVMPGTSGLELLETIHGIDPDMPVILVTAYADLGKAVESVKKGAYDFIMKPYDPEQLLRSLDKAVRYRRLVLIEKEYQGKLEDFNKEMETLVAERSMNLMALTVADRVRNPATVIGLACKKIMDKKVPAELKKYVSFIRDEADKLETMVKSFQNLLGSRRSVFGYEDVNEVVKNVISLIGKESAQKGIKLILRLAEQPLKINMQKSLWRVAIQHVLRNAIEATPAGGEVIVTTAAEQDNVALAIGDSGTGIPEQDRELIFEPFYSTKEHRYGMGLPLIKQIVSEHLGEISLTSEPGKGTTFRIVFPSRWKEQ